MNNIRIGCCGFPMSHEDYFSRFRLVEVQQTFFHPPRSSSLERWRAEAPADFEFTLKAWQLITHDAGSPTYRRLRGHISREQRYQFGSFRPTQEVMGAWHTTLEAAQALKATAIVFQCPVSFTPTAAHIANLQRFFRTIRDAARGIGLCWEPRGDWPQATVTALCEELGLIRVVDPFRSDPHPHPHPHPQGPHYLRLQGRGSYQYAYSDAELQQIAARCLGETWCLFNNTLMTEDAARLRSILGQA